MDINYNIVSYLVYLPITVFITVRVGWICYTNGRAFTSQIFENDLDIIDPLNKMLLMGYYLLNIGYCLITLHFWETVESLNQMIEVLSQNIGLIVTGLALMHYFNIAVICLWNLPKEERQLLFTRFLGEA